MFFRFLIAFLQFSEKGDIALSQGRAGWNVGLLVKHLAEMPRACPVKSTSWGWSGEEAGPPAVEAVR